MKRIYADRDSLGLGAKVNNNLSQSDKLLQAKNLLSLSASKYSKSRRSNALNKISEEIGEEEENLSISDKKIKKQKDSKKTVFASMKENDRVRSSSSINFASTEDFMNQLNK